MNYEGKIIKLLPEETVGKNNLRKRTIVLEEINDREWKGWLVVDFFNDKIDLLNWFKEGDHVNVGINTRANEYNWRRFNGVSGWKVDAIASNSWPTTPEAASVPTEQYSDDLPF